MREIRATADTGDDGRPLCPYARCGGLLEVQVEGTWGDRKAVYGTCTTCARPAEVVEGVEQLELGGTDG